MKTILKRDEYAIVHNSACSTRVITGNGYPQMSAIIETRKAINKFNHYNDKSVTIICDGGLKTSGDIMKALTCADTVMLGSLLAGTYEAPGEIIELDSKPYKCYRGMASTAAMNSIGARKKAAEGIDGLIPYKGSVKDVITKLTDGIRSGMSYLNCANISELHDGSIEAVKITQNGRNESIPHMTLNKNNVFNEKVNYNE